MPDTNIAHGAIGLRACYAMPSTENTAHCQTLVGSVQSLDEWEGKEAERARVKEEIEVLRRVEQEARSTLL
eukprot:419083-Rhodomonas_salina.2